MNFTLISPVHTEYNKIMMQRHLHQRANRSKENISLLIQPSPPHHQESQLNDGLPRAGQNLLNNSWIAKTSYEYECSPARKKFNDEKQKMKRLYKDELRETLVDQINRKNEEIERNRKMSKTMAV